MQLVMLTVPADVSERDQVAVISPAREDGESNYQTTPVQVSHLYYTPPSGKNSSSSTSSSSGSDHRAEVIVAPGEAMEEKEQHEKETRPSTTE